METYNEKEKKQQKIHRACCYMRVACAEQLNLPEEQMEISQKYAMLNHSVITDIVAGHGVSRLKNDPSLQKLLEIASKGKISMVITKSPYEFGGNLNQAGYIQNKLKRMGVEVRYMEKPPFCKSTKPYQRHKTMKKPLNRCRLKNGYPYRKRER